MQKYLNLKKLFCYLLAFVLFFCVDIYTPGSAREVKAAGNDCKIHFITLSDNSDAILLECNGQFGMVDSGEDSDYPRGDNPIYPLRAGITIGNGSEKKVISYMHSVGVTPDNFEFYIGTHAHSDHIGSADEVINEFKPKRV